MPHLLVSQLRFARREFVRGLEGVSELDAVKRIEPLNCISWMVGHLASQENGYWVRAGQSRTLYPGLNDMVGFGKPASTPPLADMWAAWRDITAAADAYLDTLTPALLVTHLAPAGRRRDESVGTMLQRNIYHYWYHIGESAAVRQALGHKDLPQFVGDMTEAAYAPE